MEVAGGDDPCVALDDALDPALAKKVRIVAALARAPEDDAR